MFGIKKKEDSYFKELLENACLPTEDNVIKSSIEENGMWEESEEWRISTWTDFKISKIEKDGEVWFKVEVKCDHEFTCHCPTIERAIKMAALYQKMIMTMLYQIGWPSWVTLEKSRL